MERFTELLDSFKKEFEYAISLISRCTNDYIFYFNITKDYYYISERALDKFDFPNNYFANASENIMKIVYEEDRELLENDVYELKNRLKKEHNLEYRWYDRDGNIVWINCHGIVTDHNEEDVVLVGCIVEIGSDKKADNITGLKMENQVYSDFKLLVGEDAVGEGAMIMIGIDNFKGINDIYGTEIGDYIMRSLAELLYKLKDEQSYLYRINGDGFLIVDFSNGSKEKCHSLYVDLRNSLDKITKKLNYKAIYTISAGITEFNKEDSISEIIHKVEFSLAQAKRNGKNCTFIYNDAAYNLHIRRLAILEKMRQSIDNDFEGFKVFYQPIMDCTGQNIIGAEALLRWECDEFKDVYPNEFIPILEESYLIILVGKWVFNTAIRQCKQWQTLVPDFKININLSYIQIKKSNVIDDIIKCINETGIDPGTVVFELTENSYIESDIRIRKLVDAFKKHGIQLAIDDFGTGYSNFALLHNLKVSTLKLDRNVVMKALQSNYNFKLMGNIVNMAHNVNLKVCFEGVETKEEKERLDFFKPDYIQGFLYGRPTDSVTFEKLYLKEKKDILPIVEDSNIEPITEVSPGFIEGLEDSDSLTSYKLKAVLGHLGMATFDYDIVNDILFIRKEDMKVPEFTMHWCKDGGKYYYLENLTARLKDIVRASFVDSTMGSLEKVKNNISGNTITFDVPLMFKDNKCRWGNMIVGTILNENKEPTHAVGYYKDIHEQKKELFRLRRIAQTDSLTGFRNKVSAEFKIKDKLIEDKDNKYFLAVLDLDKFKNANDLFGHSFGDQILKGVSERIKEFYDNEIIVSRTGGDEFMIFRKCDDEDHAQKFLTEVYNRILHVEESQGLEFKVKSSIGYAIYPNHGVSYEVLYDKADVAMYHAKNKRMDKPVLYEDSMEGIRI